MVTEDSGTEMRVLLVMVGNGGFVRRKNLLVKFVKARLFDYLI